MSQNFYVTCLCGGELPVRLADAGTSKTCFKCGASVDVPSASKLKQNAGDREPFLGPLEKIAKAACDRVSPFDGRCHKCGDAKADFHAPVTLSLLMERAETTRPAVIPVGVGVIVVSAGHDEHWRQTRFPLMLCRNCQAKFDSERGGSWSWLLYLVFAAIALAMFVPLVRGIVIAIALLVAFGALIMSRLPKPEQSIDRSLLPWLRRIEWVDEVLQSGGGVQLSVGPSEPIDSVTD